MACKGSCSIYENRPKFCRDYPQIHDAIPAGCTYHFVGQERRGSCQPEVCGQNMCCSWPREGGEPEGIVLASESGGMPCKHLRWEELPFEKSASVDDPPCTDLEASFAINDLLQDI
jgi:hypothetical protein